MGKYQLNDHSSMPALEPRPEECSSCKSQILAGFINSPQPNHPANRNRLLELYHMTELSQLTLSFHIIYVVVLEYFIYISSYIFLIY